MFKKYKQIIISFILGALIFSNITSYSLEGSKDINVSYKNIKISVDGKEIKTESEPFIYNGRTYVPIRAVVEALGAGVNWNDATKTVEISKKPTTKSTQIESTDAKDTEIRKETKPETKEVTVYVTETGTKYHSSGCRHLSKSKISMNLSAARINYSPCSVCSPPK